MCSAMETIGNLWGNVYTETGEVYWKNRKLFLFCVSTRTDVLSLEELVLLFTSISWLWQLSAVRNKHV